MRTKRALAGGAGRQRGIAAVELAIVLPVLVLMLVMPLYLGRVFWHYTVIQNAAHDAARYLSKIPASEMNNPTRGPAAVAVADAIVAEELAEVAPGEFRYTLLISCGGFECAGYSRPAEVRVAIEMILEDIFFPSLNPLSITLQAAVTYPYQGR